MNSWTYTAISMIALLLSIYAFISFTKLLNSSDDIHYDRICFNDLSLMPRILAWLCPKYSCINIFKLMPVDKSFLYLQYDLPRSPQLYTTMERYRSGWTIYSYDMYSGYHTRRNMYDFWKMFYSHNILNIKQFPNHTDKTANYDNLSRYEFEYIWQQIHPETIRRSQQFK